MPDEVGRTRRWLQEVVVNLDLCPFARGPLQAGRVRIARSDAKDTVSALSDLGLELQRLLVAEPGELETTLVVFSVAFPQFADFLEATALARDLVASVAEGVLQVADFHPEYAFADVAKTDPSNWTNRSPFPMWHVLRESSVARAVEGHPDAYGIPERNVALLREMDVRSLKEMIAGRDQE
jgi:uncharacterized protein